MKKFILLMLFGLLFISCTKEDYKQYREYQNGTNVWIRLDALGRKTESLKNYKGETLTEPLTITGVMAINQGSYLDDVVGANGDSSAYWEVNLTSKKPHPIWEFWEKADGKRDSSITKIEQ